LYSFSSSDNERADVCGSFPHHFHAGQKIGTVDSIDAQARKALHNPGNVAARGLDLHRHRDGVAVVLDQEEDRQLFDRGDVQGFPELAFAG
jgi:hypothetical protein